MANERVNPPTYLKTPEEFKKKIPLTKYFEQIEYILFQLWKRTNALEIQTFNIVEVAAAYQVLVSDGAINCLGTFTVTLPNIADAVKDITVTSTVGTITVAGDATIQGITSLTTGTSAVWYPARGEWWRK